MSRRTTGESNYASDSLPPRNVFRPSHILHSTASRSLSEAMTTRRDSHLTLFVSLSVPRPPSLALGLIAFLSRFSAPQQNQPHHLLLHLRYRQPRIPSS